MWGVGVPIIIRLTAQGGNNITLSMLCNVIIQTLPGGGARRTEVGAKPVLDAVEYTVTITIDTSHIMLCVGNSNNYH